MAPNARNGRRPTPSVRVFGWVLCGWVLCTSLACAADETTDGGGAAGSGNASAGGGGQGGDAVGGQGGQGGEGGQGGSAYECLTDAPAETRGSAIALSPDNDVLLVANRDHDSVTVFSVDEAGVPTQEATIDTGAGSEPWQVAIDGCGGRGYVVLRGSQRVVAIDDLKNRPALGPEVSVGSEPTGLALSPHNTSLYVANWVEGTVSVIRTVDMTVTGTVDLNATLVATELLGAIAARPALAHPRSIAVTNRGSTDADEIIVATEWFAQRATPETITGSNADIAKKGLIYHIHGGTLAAKTLDLPFTNAGFSFRDHNSANTQCFPNQIASVTIKGDYAYLPCTCASPKGPIGVFRPATCAVDADCGSLGGVCDLGTSTCLPNTTDVRTTSHPALTIVNVVNNSAVTRTLDQLYDTTTVASERMPLLPTDLAFHQGVAYITAQGTDAVFRLNVDTWHFTVDVEANNFVDLRADAADGEYKSPIGIAISDGFDAHAFVANDGTWSVSVLDVKDQVLVDTVPSVDLPSGAALAILRGKRLFNTGLDRWSLAGKGWSACAVCHIDGLSDGVTWYFDRGPRQSIGLDGAFSSVDAADRRIFNWTANLDEVADFEQHVRNVAGGLGAIVTAGDVAIDLAAETPPQLGLSGSTDDVADPSGASGHPHSTREDWNDIRAYLESIRSPRRPVGLNPADVATGKILFETQGNCVGCHSGDKWTISSVGWTVDDTHNNGASTAVGTLRGTTWDVALNGFPPELFPNAAPTPTTAVMLFGNAPDLDQMQCALRPVGTYNVAPAAVGIAEVRQNMSTPAQGAATDGRGYNVPSLLGVQVGAPYFHAGNARTLEEVFDDIFAGHHQSAIAAGFTPTAEQKAQLVAYLLSIDEDEPVFGIPSKGATGGILCLEP